MEGADLVVRIGAHREALERSRERGPDRIGRPTRIAGRRCPAVVVRRASDGDNAAVVSGAPPDHARPREGDRLPSGQLAARVAPVVRGDERTAVEEVCRPVAGRSRARSPAPPRRAPPKRPSRPRASRRRPSRCSQLRRRRRHIRLGAPRGEYRSDGERPEQPGGVQDGGGGPTTRRGRARAARAAWRPARLRGAHADVRGNRLQDGLRDRRLGHGGRGGRARRLREGLLGARPVPARQAVPALAAHDRRERGAQPPALGRPRARARAARGRRDPPRAIRRRPPRPRCSDTSGTSYCSLPSTGFPRSSASSSSAASSSI